jgi:phosphatidylglycerol:prolipoprotein diacylglycerol transferase
VLFEIPKIGPVGPIPVHSFGVMILLALMLGIFISRKRAARYNITSDQISDAAFWTVIAGVLGARVLFLVQDIGYYKNHLSEVFSFKFQGMTSFGGPLFSSVAMWIWARKANYPSSKLFDLFAPAFIGAHVVGRFGCLLNGCCYGGVCPVDYPAGIHVEGSPLLHHPAQVYDAAMNLVVLGILLWREKIGLGPWKLTGLTLVLHGLTRFIYEFWRAGTEDQVRTGAASSTYWGTLPITQAQGMAIAVMIVGALIIVVNRKPVEPLNPVPTPVEVS